MLIPKNAIAVIASAMNTNVGSSTPHMKAIKYAKQNVNITNKITFVG